MNLLITETEGPWGTNGGRNMVAHYEVPIHRDRLLVARRGAGGGAAQPEGSKPDSRLQSPEIRRCVRREEYNTPGEAGCDMDKRGPGNMGRSIRADIDDTIRQQPSASPARRSAQSADSGRPSPEPDERG